MTGGYPTDPAQEARGRIPVWLDVDDVRVLALTCICHRDAAGRCTTWCLRTRLRANAALHKAGLKPPPAAN